MTPPASPRLPEAVEQAIVGLADQQAMSDEGSVNALRATILAYGAARERQGIERAARFLDTMAAEMKNLEEARVGVSVAAEHLRALPVDGATP